MPPTDPDVPRDPDQDAPRRGPNPDRLKIDGYDDWTDAVRDGLRKPRPKDGWPEPGKKPTKKNGRRAE